MIIIHTNTVNVATMTTPMILAHLEFGVKVKVATLM